MQPRPSIPHQTDKYETIINKILAEMTLEEKIGQMVQVDITYKIDLDDAIRTGQVGSLLSIRDPFVIQRYQQIAVEESRLGIPLLVGNDVLHGFRTIFPIPLALSCSWNLALIEAVAEEIGLEAIAAGTSWNYSPMVDICRDPRWGRVAEGGGEDPMLGGVIAQAWVRGFQKAAITGRHRMAACIKHFAAYGGAESGRDYNTVNIGERLLRDVYLPPYRQGLQAGALTVMTSFNELDGVPATANTHLMIDILRKQWGFDGVLISDYDAIGELVPHGIAQDLRQAALLAIRAGVDIDMMSGAYPAHLAELVQMGQVPLSAVDASVRRILRLKAQLDLFDHPYGEPDKATHQFHDPRRQELARRAAEDSLVLLQNGDGILPFHPKGQTIALIGPLATDRESVLGCWRFAGRPEETLTLAEGLRDALPEDTRLIVVPGCGVDEPNLDKKAVQEAMGQADLVVLAIGEDATMSGEAHSRAHLDLPGRQSELVELAVSSEKPTVAVLFAGRPLVITDLVEKVDGILLAWHPGSHTAQAVTNVLLGSSQPSGRLTISFPRGLGQIPVYYAHKSTGRPADSAGTAQFNEQFRSIYLDEDNEPLFPFGFGLTYTQFEYEDLFVETPQVTRESHLIVSAMVKNTGDCMGEEVVQLYIRDLVASVTRPVKELVSFQKVRLAPGESKRIRFKVPAARFAFTGLNYRLTLEPGQFQVWFASDCQNGLTGQFSLV